MELKVFNTGQRGILIPHDKKATSLLNSMPRGSYLVNIDIDKVLNKPIRSNMQNAYYWAVVIQYIVRATEDSYDKDEAHDMLKYEYFGVKEVVTPSGFVFFKPAGSTSKLKVDEMEIYLSRARLWAQEKLNIFIPLPNECGMEY